MGLTVYGGGGKPEEEKTVTAGTSAIVVNPSSGKVMKKVTVNPTPTESKSVTPTTSELTVTPSEGKHLSQVVVGAVEDVTPEVNAQTPVITQMAEKLGVTITTPSGTNKQILQGNNTNLLNIKENAKKEGAYVWKKYSPGITITNPTFTAVVTSSNITITNPSFDLSYITQNNYKEILNGFQYSINENMHFALESGKLYWYSTASSKQEVTAYSNGVITVKVTANTGTYASMFEGDKTFVEQQFLDYVVSDSPTAYPDGGEQGGYWYEKVVEGVAGIDFGEVTLASTASSVTVSHNLGAVPSWVALVPKVFSRASNTTTENINGTVIYHSSYGDNTITSKNNTLTTTEITFAAYSTSYKFKATDYYWIAIA